MAKGKNKDYVSFWFWFFALFVTALPCIGFVMVIIWALVGENQSRKNYFRAVIAWCLILTVAWFVIMTFGFWPVIRNEGKMWMQQKGYIQPSTSNAAPALKESKRGAK